MRHFLDLRDLEAKEARALLDAAMARKARRRARFKGEADADAPLSGARLAMIFEKNSTRTRVSFDQAITQLGGSALVLNAADTQLGRGETIADTAQVLSRYVDAIMARTKAHAALVELAEHASVPVINGLTDWSHPCQIMADLMTVKSAHGALEGLRFAWVGDGNNVARSFAHAAQLFEFDLTLACPQGYGLSDRASEDHGDRVRTVQNPHEAVEGADVVIADTWVSMGDLDRDKRLADLGAYQVDAALMAQAKPEAVFLHCLPAHRGEEVSAEVIDGPQSRVFEEAENRLHAQKAILLSCFGL
ncbi:MAG: ornithine carbamoyltransferase [Maricaulaceae bacterium]